MLDLLLRGVRVADGTGNPWFRADLGIRNGRFEAIGPDLLQHENAERIIDGEGLVAAPGFVDCHSHADFVLSDPDHPSILEGLVRQGITTVVTGNCGYSPFPTRNSDDAALLAGYSAFLQSDGWGGPLRDASEFIDQLETKGVSLNVIPLTSHGTVRLCVKGLSAGVATDAECAEMANLVRADLEGGAWGLSSGLIYPPGMYSNTEELIRICEPLRDSHAVYTSHIRGSSETLLQATAEVIRIAETLGIKAEHSHVEAFGEPFWSQIDAVLEMHDAARRRGVDVGIDVIPYIAANTTLFATLPPWAMEGGVAELVKRLSDPETRERIRLSVEEDMPGWPSWLPGAWPHNLVRATGWKNIRLISAAHAENKQFEGMSFLEISRKLGKSPFDAAADMLLEEKGAAMALYIGSSGENDSDDPWHKKLIAHHQVSIETDAIVTGRGIPHPAAYGAFPKCLRQYCREEQLVPLEEMIRKMSWQSLARFGIRDRGIIREGARADLVLFDPDTVTDRATYEDPVQYPLGIESVLINGIPVLENGVYSGEKCGRVLRRTG